LSFTELVDDGLFTINMLARLHGLNGYLLVPVIGGSDDYSIYIVPIENFLVVFGKKKVIAPGALGLVQAGIIKITNGHQLGTFHPQGRVGVGSPHSSSTDQTQTNRLDFVFYKIYGLSLQKARGII